MPSTNESGTACSARPKIGYICCQELCSLILEYIPPIKVLFGSVGCIWALCPLGADPNNPVISRLWLQRLKVHHCAFPCRVSNLIYLQRWLLWNCVWLESLRSLSDDLFPTKLQSNSTTPTLQDCLALIDVVHNTVKLKDNYVASTSAVSNSESYRAHKAVKIFPLHLTW